MKNEKKFQQRTTKNKILNVDFRTKNYNIGILKQLGKGRYTC